MLKVLVREALGLVSYEAHSLIGFLSASCPGPEEPSAMGPAALYG
jgi:hypothetical protein